MIFLREIRPGVCTALNIPEPIPIETRDKLTADGYREMTASEISTLPIEEHL